MHEVELRMKWGVALNMAGSYATSGRYDDAAAVMRTFLDEIGERLSVEERLEIQGQRNVFDD